MATKRKQAGAKRRRDTGTKAAAAAPPERPVEDSPQPAAPLEQRARQTSQAAAQAPPPGPGPRGAPDMLFTPEGMIEERAWHPPGLREKRPEEKSLQELIASVQTGIGALPKEHFDELREQLFAEVRNLETTK